jgi:hypothetical protein
MRAAHRNYIAVGILVLVSGLLFFTFARDSGAAALVKLAQPAPPPPPHAALYAFSTPDSNKVLTTSVDPQTPRYRRHYQHFSIR